MLFPAIRRLLTDRAVVWTGLAATLATADIAGVRAQRATLGEPAARPAVAAIADAFREYRMVAIGEGHRNQQVHDFMVMLLRDPRFLSLGGDIVVEFGNARYQGLMDRYTEGESIAPGELEQVWRDAMNILVWDAPVYARFFATVRSVNETRSPPTRLRVLLADPPIDWRTIQDRAAWEQIVGTRDQHAAQVIDREVLGKGHRALLIFGSGHVIREKAFEAYGSSRSRVYLPNLAELLEQRHPGSTLLVWAHMGWMDDEQA